jgi:hypothetical protein
MHLNPKNSLDFVRLSYWYSLFVFGTNINVNNTFLVAYLNTRLINLLFQEDAKVLRKRNIRVFSEILDNMPNLIHSTTWSETQQMLLDNPRFTEDTDLQSEWIFHLQV